MKKILAIAVAAFAFAACGGGNGGSSSSNVEPIKDGVTMESEHFTIMVPQGMVESWNSMGTINASSEDGAVRLAVTYMEGGPTKSQLKETGANYKAMVHALDQNATIGEPKVDGNVVTLKSTCEGKPRIDFTYLKEDRVGVCGSLVYPEDKAAQWEDKLLPILKTVVFK